MQQNNIDHTPNTQETPKTMTLSSHVVNNKQPNQYKKDELPKQCIQPGTNILMTIRKNTSKHN